MAIVATHLRLLTNCCVLQVLYLDEGLFITRGNNGTIHVMVRSNLLCPTQELDSQIDGCVKSATEICDSTSNDSAAKTSIQTTDTGKRKAGAMESTTQEGRSPPPSFWQEALKKDLATRNKDTIADDLSKILQEYGIQIADISKRAKLN